MQLFKNEAKFDFKKVEKFLLNENQFITNLLSVAALPERRNLDEEDAEEKPNLFNNSNKKSRAKSFQELEERLKAITGKKRLSYKEKLAKKGLKNRMKKKSKQDERNAKMKLGRAVKHTQSDDNDKNQAELESNINSAEKPKPVFNSKDKIVFSKIGFANLGKKKVTKHEKDPKKLLKKITEEKNMLEKLEKSGEIGKVIEIKEKTFWKNALAKAEGQKVKDDPMLLKKSVKKKEQQVRSSKKKWEARIHGVERAKEERQKKRGQNIEKRKKEKKVKKLKSAAKRGKIIPGF